MSWYDDAWEQRWPIVTPDTGGTSDLQVTIPKNWDAFWDNIQDTTNGYDIIVCDGDGETLTSFQLSSFNYSTKTCVIQIDNYTYGANLQYTLWLYWNKESPSDLQTTFTAGTLHTMQIALYDPQSAWWNFEINPERPGATAPADEISKNTGEAINVWLKMPSSAAGQRLAPSAGSLVYDEPMVWFFKVQLAGVDQAAMVDDTKNYMVLDGNGDAWAGCHIKQGTVDVDYTGLFGVSLSRDAVTNTVTLYKRFLIRVRNPDET